MGNKMAKKTRPNNSAERESSKVKLISVKHKKQSQPRLQDHERKTKDIDSCNDHQNDQCEKQKKNDLNKQQQPIVDDGCHNNNEEEKQLEANIISFEEQNNKLKDGETQQQQQQQQQQQHNNNNSNNNNNNSNNNNNNKECDKQDEVIVDKITNELNVNEGYVFRFYDSILAEAFKEIVEINRKDSLIVTTEEHKVEEEKKEEPPTTYVSRGENIQEQNPFIKHNQLSKQSYKKENKNVTTKAEVNEDYIKQYGEKLSLDIMKHVKLHLG